MKEINGFEHYFVTEDGEVLSSKSGSLKIRKQVINNNGYPFVQLQLNSKRHYRLISRLVAEVFISNPLNLPHVCHKDDNPLNNHVDNLFWGTQQDNSKDMVLKGRQCCGIKNGGHKLTESEVLSIRQYPKHRGSGKELSERFNVGVWIISRIRNNHQWKHLL